MGATAAPYEAYHPHLAYTLGLTLVGWMIVLGYSRTALVRAPRARAMLYGVVIMLPLLAELSNATVYSLRPSVETPLGALLSSIHWRYLQRLNIDSFLSPLLLGTIVVVLLGLLLLSTARLLRAGRQIRRLARYADSLDDAGYPALQHRVADLAAARGLAVPPIGVLPLDAPVAFTAGFLRQRIYIAHFLLELLTEDEAVAVLCHELAHVSRGDNVWNWLVRLFRDMSWFLPVNFIGWRMMVVSQDEDCDALAVQITRDPLTMARALVKVAGAWRQEAQLDLAGISAFARGPNVVVRVEQLLAIDEAGPASRRAPIAGAAAIAVALVLLGALPSLLGS